MSQTMEPEVHPPRPTTSRSAGEAPRRAHVPQEMTVTKFDQVSSMLLAFAMFLGILVGMLFLLWLTSGKPKPPITYPPIEEIAAGRGQNAEGFARDFDPPGAEEVEELLEPTMEETLQAVTDAASTVPATFESVDSNATANSSGSGQGDSRQAGPEGEGEDIIPRFERWKLRFLAKDLNAYATQLDFFEIELAAVGGGIQGVDYAAGLAGSPRTRRGSSDDESRLYFMWTTPGPLMQYDRQLLQKAGVPLNDRQMLKFIPQGLENMLAHIELEHAKSNGHASITEVAQTVFEAQPGEGGFTFVVIDQKYRRPRRSR